MQKYIVRRIQEECYAEHLSLIPDQFEEGKMRLLRGTLSFNLLWILARKWGPEILSTKIFWLSFQQTLIIKWEKQPVWENCIPCPSTQSPSKIYLKASSKFFSTSVPLAILWIWLKKCASIGRLKLKNKNGNFWENGSDSYQKEWNNFPPSLSIFFPCFNFQWWYLAENMVKFFDSD